MSRTGNQAKGQKPIIAVCGKGGVGKTALSALLARGFLDLAAKPLLLIDADPAGGLISVMGQKAKSSLAQARERMIESARSGDPAAKTRLAQDLDYLVMAALEEREGYAFLAIGRMEEKGCFCPANTLLREAIDLLAEPFALVLIDAEAGLEQISRQVTRNVTKVLAVSDGSARSLDTVNLIGEMVGIERMAIVLNRLDEKAACAIVDGLPPALARSQVLGFVPEDKTLLDFDRQGRTLWDLPQDSPARKNALKIAKVLLKEANSVNPDATN
ncbi:MAG: AAA family ATPase [Desulfatibacillaceae bacterium]|nr:AAA family ATPase [Desulfatibacillaceae bacterium]